MRSRGMVAIYLVLSPVIGRRQHGSEGSSEANTGTAHS